MERLPVVVYASYTYTLLKIVRFRPILYMLYFVSCEKVSLNIGRDSFVLLRSAYLSKVLYQIQRKVFLYTLHRRNDYG